MYNIGDVKVLKLPPQGATWANDDLSYITEIFMTQDSIISLRDANGKIRKYPRMLVSVKMFKQNLASRSYLLSNIGFYVDNIENKKEDILTKLSENE